MSEENIKKIIYKRKDEKSFKLKRFNGTEYVDVKVGDLIRLKGINSPLCKVLEITPNSVTYIVQPYEDKKRKKNE